MVHFKLPVLLSLLVLASTGCVIQARGDGVDGSFERTISLSGPGNVSVSSRSGTIRVSAGSSDQVHVSATIRAFGNLSYTASDQVHELESDPPIRVTGSSITIGEIDDWMLGSNVTISYDVAVPPEVRMRTSSPSGKQIITSLRGALDASSHSGSISLDDVRGPLRLGSRSGDVTVNGEPAGQWEIETRSGDVTLRVPSASAFDVDVESHSGSIRTSRVFALSGTSLRKGFKGRVRGGGAPIVVDTRSGSISIE